MNPEQVHEKLVEVLVEIQTDSGLEIPDIVGNLRPANDLPEFDSLIWPAATGMLAERLGIEIPNNENLFVSADGRHWRSIDEIVARVVELVGN